MKIPFSWLKDFIDTDMPPERVAEILTETGVEAGCEVFGNDTPGVITVKILSNEKRVGTEKLRKCVVTDGKRDYTVITGANNALTGSCALFAPAGVTIEGNEIAHREMGGVTSEGMLLSLQELGVACQDEGIFLLDDNTTPGCDGCEETGLGRERIIEIEATPNRGDVLSVRGLGREIAAVLGIEFKDRNYALTEVGLEELPFEIDDSSAHRYRGIVIKGAVVKPSSLLVRLRLIKSGLQPINNIVDITNYILYQEGQPLHAFDLSKLKGNLRVRRAIDKEEIKTIDKEVYRLAPGDVVIADDKSAVAVAGVMGGYDTRVDNETSDIFLEAALFDPGDVRRTSKRLGLQTDSSYRFERSIDFDRLESAQNLAANLIVSAGGGKIEKLFNSTPQPYSPKEVILKFSEIERILGEPVEGEKAVQYLSRLGIACKMTDKSLTAAIPAFRASDIERPVDLIEEIARVQGYNNFAPSYPRIPSECFKVNQSFLFESRTRDFMVACSLNEVVNYTFLDEKSCDDLGVTPPEVAISNYLNINHSHLRTSLIPGVIHTTIENIRQGIADIAIFELSTCIFTNHEEKRLAILVTGKEAGGFGFKKGKISFSTEEAWSFLKIKRIVNNYLSMLGAPAVEYRVEDLSFLHPYESAKIVVNGQETGFFGKINPGKADFLDLPKDLWLAELKLSFISRDVHEKTADKAGYLYNIFLSAKGRAFKELPKYPSIARDLAVVVDEKLDAETVIGEVRRCAGLIEDVNLFDIYFVEGQKKSIALSIVFRAVDRTLLDEEADALIADIVKRLKKKIPDMTLR